MDVLFSCQLILNPIIHCFDQYIFSLAPKYGTSFLSKIGKLIVLFNTIVFPMALVLSFILPKKNSCWCMLCYCLLVSFSQVSGSFKLSYGRVVNPVVHFAGQIMTNSTYFLTWPGKHCCKQRAVYLCTGTWRELETFQKPGFLHHLNLYPS